MRNCKWYRTIRIRSFSFERKATYNREDILKHFDDFKAIYKRYRIDPADIYNIDETGFRIGCINRRIVITYANTKAVYLSDPENRDYITSIECICGDRSTIPPIIILKGAVLLEAYFRNNLDGNTLFATTETGYINDAFRIE